MLGIEPGSLKHSESGWMAGPKRGPFFESRSFPSPKQRTEFDEAILLAERAANYDGPPIHVRLPERNKRTAMVFLREVGALFIACDWPDIPAPLVTLATKEPPAPETVPSASATKHAPPALLQNARQPDAQNNASVSPEAVSVATKETRQERRYQACIDAGLSMPTDTYVHLPRGISELAKQEGITRQAFSEDVKAHIGRLYGK